MTLIRIHNDPWNGALPARRPPAPDRSPAAPADRSHLRCRTATQKTRKGGKGIYGWGDHPLS